MNCAKGEAGVGKKNKTQDESGKNQWGEDSKWGDETRKKREKLVWKSLLLSLEGQKGDSAKILTIFSKLLQFLKTRNVHQGYRIGMEKMERLEKPSALCRR